jgi:hypothetical protein
VQKREDGGIGKETSTSTWTTFQMEDKNARRKTSRRTSFTTMQTTPAR